MNPILVFGLQVFFTALLCAALLAYLRPSLFGVLVDLCGSEPRARFWLSLSILLLLGLPLCVAFSYRPQELTGTDLFFELAGRLGGNLASLLVTSAIIGLVISFFALVTPRAGKN